MAEQYRIVVTWCNRKTWQQESRSFPAGQKQQAETLFRSLAPELRLAIRTARFAGIPLQERS